MTVNVRISAIEYFLPNCLLENQEIIERYGFDREFIENKLGILERHRAGNDESCHTLADNACKKLINRHNIDTDSIQLLIVVTQNPDYKLPNVAPLLQMSLGLKDNVASFDISLGCSGFVYALAIAKSLMTTCHFSRALITTSDPYSKVMAFDDRSTVPLFGDAAAAILLDAAAEEGIGEFDFGTDGSGSESLIVRTGGSRFPESSPTPKDNFLFMDGRAIYTFMMKRVPISVDRCLQINRLSPDDVEFYVFHQASKFMLQSLMGRMNIPENKIIYKIEKCGNTVSSSIPMALKDLIEDPTNPGKVALLSGFGVGLSWATTVIRL